MKERFLSFLFSLFMLSFLLTACDIPGGTDVPPAYDTEDGGGDASKPSEEEVEIDDGYLDIETVTVGAFRKHTLIFPGIALDTTLPLAWSFSEDSPGEYTVCRDGRVIGSFVSGAHHTEGWKTVATDSFDTEDVLIATAIERLDVGDASTYRHVLQFAAQEDPTRSATLCVSYEQLDTSAFYRIWRETALSSLSGTPNYGALWEVEEGDTILILGNSFVGTSAVGRILSQMCEDAPYRIEVKAISRGYAEVSTYVADPVLVQEIKDGAYGCVFICGFYDSGEIESLRDLMAACEASGSPLVLFPAHNESSDVINQATNVSEALYYLPWKSEINALIESGVDYWDMCINDVHKHSTPLAGYVGAHMIYRAIFDESPSAVSVEGVISAYEIEEILGSTYIRTGVLCDASERVLVFS